MHAAHRARGGHQEHFVVPGGEDLARDAGGAVGGEEHRHRRVLVRRHLLDLFQPRLLLRRVHGDRARHAAPGEGRDAVAAHVVAHHVQRDGLGQRRDAQLRRRVVRLAEIADQARGGGHVHEGAALLLAVVFRRGAGDVERAREMHVDHRVPVILGHLVEDHVAQDAGVVHHAVDPAIGVQRALHDALGGIPGGHALGVDHRLPAALLDDRLGLFRRGGGTAIARDGHTDIVDDHLGAFAGHHERDLAPDAATRTRDHHNLAFDDPGHCFLRMTLDART